MIINQAFAWFFITINSMNELISITGIVIAKHQSNDFDEVLEILTSDGKKTIFAPGIRKIESKNRNALNLLDYSSFEIFTSNQNIKLLPRLKKASLIKQFPVEINLINFKNELLLFLNKLKLSKAKNFLITFNNLSNLLNQNMDNKIFAYLLYTLLKDEGINPKMDGCIECNSKEHLIDFKFYKGGFLCQNHSDDILGKEKLMALYNLSISFEQFANNTSFVITIEIKNMLIEYLSEYINLF